MKKLMASMVIMKVINNIIKKESWHGVSKWRKEAINENIKHEKQ